MGLIKSNNDIFQPKTKNVKGVSTLNKFNINSCPVQAPSFPYTTKCCVHFSLPIKTFNCTTTIKVPMKNETIYYRDRNLLSIIIIRTRIRNQSKATINF